MRLAVVLQLFSYCGMRPSETFALCRDHLDFERGRICLDGQLDCRGELQALKNSRKREVVMDDAVATALQWVVFWTMMAAVAAHKDAFRPAKKLADRVLIALRVSWPPSRRAPEPLHNPTAPCGALVLVPEIVELEAVDLGGVIPLQSVANMSP